MQKLLNTPKDRELIFDVGMHKGEDTEFYLKKGFRVVAIEADPNLGTYCRLRLGEFIRSGQLTLIEGAVVNPALAENGSRKVTFYKNEAITAWGTVCSAWADRNARLGTSSVKLQVDLVDFTQVLQTHGIPHYLKIDIEGLDMVCIEALGRFRNRPSYLSLESAKTGFANIRREINALAALGYDRFQAVEQSAIPSIQSPPNPPKEGKHATHSFEPGSSGVFGSELPGEWKCKRRILNQYRAILLGYYLLGDDGIMNGWRFRGAARFRSMVRTGVGAITGAAVPGWYDTHARHSEVECVRSTSVA